MKLHVILGPPGAGKAGRAVATLRDAAGTGVDAFLCVPGAVDRSRFLRELAGEGSGVLLGVEVGTFDQLLARIAGSPPVRRTDRAMERIVIRDALRDVPAFAAAARWSGFVDTASEQVDRLRRARVWGGAELERVEQNLPGEHVGQWRALEQRVAALLQERRLRDDAWFERRAANALRSGRPGIGAVVVYGFGALAPARLELLEQLAQHVPVTITLAWRPGRRVHERAADLRDRWRAKGAFIEELEAIPGSDPVLDWIGSELFEDATPSAPPSVDARLETPAPVAFVDCCGSLQEAEEVVREVALLGGHGCAWDDIVVASADAATDGELLLAAFERAGIPARLQARRRAVDVPAGRAVHDLLDAIVDGDALRLVAALRSPVFGLDPARVDATELQLRGTRHRGPDQLQDRAVHRLASDEVAALLELHAAAEARGGAVPAMRALLATLLPSDVGELDLLRGIAALLEGLVVAAGGAEGVELTDIRDAVAAFPLTVPDRSDAGTVVIASLDDLRSVAFDAVVLRGMHLGGFRARVDEESEAPAAARDLLHLAVTRTRRTLRVVRQAAGADGGHQAPSPAWQELRRLLPHAPMRTRRLGEVVIAPDDVRLESEVDPAVALAASHGIEVAGVDPATIERIDALRRRARPAQLTGPIADELASLRQLGVTAIEQYATCSAKWFVEQRLRIGDPDDDRTRILDGRLAHVLLQMLAPDVRTGRIDLGEARTRAVEHAPECAAQIDPRGALDPARIERIVEHVLALLAGEAEWLQPDHVEVERSFGSEASHSFGPGLDVDGLEVTGRIDRLDRFGSHVVLHDYKYGSTDRPAKELLADRNLQLLVYWLALEQPGAELDPIGAVYRAVTKGGAPSGVYSEELREIGMISARTKAGVLSHEQRRELLDTTRELVHDAVGGIRRGQVAPLVDTSRCPSHCRLQTICRVGEGA